MPEATVTLNDVESRDVQSRGETATVYSFKCSDGRKYTTFKRDIAVPGSQLRGRLVTIGYTEKQNGEFTNYYLNSIKLADTGIILPETPVFTAHPDSPTQEKKDVSIARAVALKAAVETAVGLQLEDASWQTILDIADAYVPWLLTGSAAQSEVEAFPF
jgi:hypothetical protein